MFRSLPKREGASLEARLLGDYSACFCTLSPTWEGSTKSLTVEKSSPTLARKDPGWVSLEQTPLTPATVPLSLLAMLQVPKKMEDFEARNQPCLPKGQCPREQRNKRMEFSVVLCRLWVVI